jgi:MraZ protein
VGGFLGQYRHTIDDKGRLTLPVRFREGLGADFFATKGLDHCLSLYPAAAWESLQASLQDLSLAQEAERRFARWLNAGATDCHLDAQGRVLLPAVLRTYAALEREAVVVGVGAKVEVWEPEAWARYDAVGDDNLTEIAGRLSIRGL